MRNQSLDSELPDNLTQSGTGLSGIRHLDTHTCLLYPSFSLPAPLMYLLYAFAAGIDGRVGGYALR